MAVAYDARTLFGPITTTDPATFTHTPAGTPRGVLVFTLAATSSDIFAGVSYGGVALIAVPGAVAVDTATELFICKAWFLGASIPAGAQTVSVDHDGSATVKEACCLTVTAAGDTQIVGTPVLLQQNGTLSEQNVDSGADVALRFAAIASGLASPPAAGASSTNIDGFSGFASGSTRYVRETAGGSGSRPVGFSSGTSDDRAAVHLAIAEVAGGGGAVTRSYVVIAG